MRLIDTHAHMDFPDFDCDRDDVILRAKEKGVEIINCSLDSQGWEKIKERKNIFHTIGCSPARLSDFESQFPLIEKNIENIVAIGEIGLDYHWVKDKTERDKQAGQFRELLALAKEHDKAVIIHSRNAERPALDMLLSEGIERAIMHCFSGPKEEALRAIGAGYLISVPTNVILSKQKQDFAKTLPLDSIILETDAPYLSPDPGTRNEPANIFRSAEKVARLRGIGIKEVAEATTKNVERLLSI